MHLAGAGRLRLPGPVLVLVRDVVTGEISLALAGFLGQPDPSD